MSHEHVGIPVREGDLSGVEQVAARPVSPNVFQLLRSPLYAMGFAAGDTVEVRADGPLRLVSRGGNVCVRLYLGAAQVDDRDATAALANRVEGRIAALGGWVDGMTPGLISFSVPVRVGFQDIESACAEIMTHAPGAQWQYANVYDPITGKPLEWWT